MRVHKLPLQVLDVLWRALQALVLFKNRLTLWSELHAPALPILDPPVGVSHTPRAADFDDRAFLPDFEFSFRAPAFPLLSFRLSGEASHARPFNKLLFG